MITPLAGARIVVAVTSPTSADFYAGQLAALRVAGAEVAFLSSPSDEVERQCADEGARYVPIDMARDLAPWRDVRALAQITRAFRALRPDLVNVGTPKAGLLGMIAAAALRVPVRVHTLHGLRYETARGLQRRALWLAQRASCAAATHIVCVSPSLQRRAVETGLIAAGASLVIGDGSVNGVDVEHLRRSPEAGRALRSSLGISAETAVVGYLGRLARDKGMAELAAAWARVRGAGRRLVFAGELDDTDPPDAGVLEALRSADDVVFLGQISDSRDFLAAIDVLVLPTYREGFPTVALEAAAMEVPVVATRSTGCVDAVVEGSTGTLVAVSDVPALADAMERYLTDPALRRRHGLAGRARVVEWFGRDRVHQLTVDLYQSLLRDLVLR